MVRNTEFDVVLLGATGFTGRLVAEYLLSRHGVSGGLRWALAGRDMQKLKVLQGELGQAANDIALIHADSHDRASLDALVARTKVVCTTVGPYALHGSELVAACAEAGADYCDLSGEVPWMRRMLDAHAETARLSGARIVHCCGFDSIPSDLGVWFLQQEAERQYAAPLSRIRMRVVGMRGKVSGGTAASMMNIIEESKRDSEVARVARSPYALCPPEARQGVRQPGVSGPKLDHLSGHWMGPFVMAAINTRVVHRSHALMGHCYGPDFQYDEAMSTGPGFRGRLRAAALTASLGAFAVGAGLAPTRLLMKKLILPSAGQGPGADQREMGFFKLVFDGETADGRQLRARVTGERDPGYGSTARMLGEAAVSLALDVPERDLPGGFWTPSTALGGQLLERLEAHAGVHFALEPAPEVNRGDR